MDRENLAWAAGFFDGEGNVRLHSSINKLVIQIWQSGSTELLERFRAIVRCGEIKGPYERPGNRRDAWVFYSYGWANGIAIVALLWTWLGTVKRDQCARTLAGWRLQASDV